MFGLMNPIKKLEKEYETKQKKAISAQRNGDMALFAKLSAEADRVLKKIEQLENPVKNS